MKLTFRAKRIEHWKHPNIRTGRWNIYIGKLALCPDISNRVRGERGREGEGERDFLDRKVYPVVEKFFEFCWHFFLFFFFFFKFLRMLKSMVWRMINFCETKIFWKFHNEIQSCWWKMLKCIKRIKILII